MTLVPPQSTPPVVATPVRILKGPQASPLLAPRGVWLINGRLLVTDTAQNRIFIWNQLPETDWQEPDLILGQSATRNTERNAGGTAAASSLHYPSGIWSDGTRLIVADAWNHRVLLWSTFPERSGQPADVVIGQPGFNSNEPNVTGIGARPGARTLYWPYGVHSDGRALWVADTGNRRVLFFEQIPTGSYPAADKVIGKPGFAERDYDHRDPVWPYSVRISSKGEMAIVDTQYYRVLYWSDWRSAVEQTAERVLGQPDLEGNGANQYNWFPAAHTLNWCYDCCFFREGIWVADTGNSRLLWYKAVPARNGPPAQGLIGQKDFNTGSENPETIRTTEGSLYWPFSISIEGKHMAVADTGNHRIIIYQIEL